MKLIVFGTGEFLKNRLSHIDLDEIIAFADNSEIKHNTIFEGKRIVKPSEINSLIYDYILIMVRDSLVDEIRMQLCGMSISATKIVTYNQYMLMRDKNEKRFAVWGTGVYCENRISCFAGRNIVAYIDSDEGKKGSLFQKQLVISPSEIKASEYDYIVVMTNHLHFFEIKEQMRELGISIDNVLSYEEFVELFPPKKVEVVDERTAFFNHFIQPGLSAHKANVMSSFQKPLITIVTPFYNTGEVFKETYYSVLNQTFPWFEWIIVDDGSTDNKSLDFVQKLADSDGRIVLYHKDNGGQATARNYGFDKAKADIVVPLDADDVIEPQYLEYIYWGLYFNKDAGFAFTWSYGFGEQQYLWKKAFDINQMKKSNTLTSTAGIRKSTWEKVGGYKKEAILYDEDWRFWLDCLSEGIVPVSLGGYKFGYRRTCTSTSAELRQDLDRSKKNRSIIEKAAERVRLQKNVKHYPNGECDLYSVSRKVEWDYQNYRIEKQDKDEKHVLWIIPWMVMGGADKFNLDAIKGLKEHGYKISIITTVSSVNDWQYLFSEITDDIYNLPEFLDPNNYLLYVEHYIRSRGIDAIMVTNSTLGYYMIPYIRNEFPHIPIIDYVHMEEWYWRGGGHARSSAVMNPFLDMTYVCNSATRQAMIDAFNVPSDKVQTMYIGVDENEFSPDNVEGGWLYDKLGIEKDRPIVLFPCRIAEQKRPLMMVEIAKGVVEKCPEVVFAVVGDGPMEQQLQQKIKQYNLTNNVICIGRCNDMKLCYKDAQLTLVCSVKEGLSLTAYESCAMATPVISADVGGQRDLIGADVGRLIKYRQNEKTDLGASVFDDIELHEYIDAIIDFLNNKVMYNQCSINCRKKILDGFTISNMKTNICDVFDNLRRKPHFCESEAALKMFYEDIYLMEVNRGR